MAVSEGPAFRGCGGGQFRRRIPRQPARGLRTRRQRFPIRDQPDSAGRFRAGAVGWAGRRIQVQALSAKRGGPIWVRLSLSKNPDSPEEEPSSVGHCGAMIAQGQGSRLPGFVGGTTV